MMTLTEKLENNIRLDYEDGVKLFDLDVITLEIIQIKLEKIDTKKRHISI